MLCDMFPNSALPNPGKAAIQELWFIGGTVTGCLRQFHSKMMWAEMWQVGAQGWGKDGKMGY